MIGKGEGMCSRYHPAFVSLWALRVSDTPFVLLRELPVGFYSLAIPGDFFPRLRYVTAISAVFSIVRDIGVLSSHRSGMSGYLFPAKFKFVHPANQCVHVCGKRYPHMMFPAFPECRAGYHDHTVLFEKLF